MNSSTDNAQPAQENTRRIASCSLCNKETVLHVTSFCSRALGSTPPNPPPPFDPYENDAYPHGTAFDRSGRPITPSEQAMLRSEWKDAVRQERETRLAASPMQRVPDCVTERQLYYKALLTQMSALTSIPSDIWKMAIFPFLQYAELDPLDKALLLMPRQKQFFSHLIPCLAVGEEHASKASPNKKRRTSPQIAKTQVALEVRCQECIVASGGCYSCKAWKCNACLADGSIPKANQMYDQELNDTFYKDDYGVKQGCNYRELREARKSMCCARNVCMWCSDECESGKCINIVCSRSEGCKSMFALKDKGCKGCKFMADNCDVGPVYFPRYCRQCYHNDARCGCQEPSVYKSFYTLYSDDDDDGNTDNDNDEYVNGEDYVMMESDGYI